MISALPPALLIAPAYKLLANKRMPELLVMAKLVMRSELLPTAPLKVTPPELVIVKLPILVPTAPENVTVSVVLIVILDLTPDTPLIELNVIGVAAPAPRVKVAPGLTVAAPKVIRPVVGLRVVLVSKVIGELSDWADAVLLISLALTVIPDEAFAVTPPKKLNTSL